MAAYIHIVRIIILYQQSKSFFSEYVIPKKIIMMEEVILYVKSSENSAENLKQPYQSNGQLEACIKFLKRMLRKCIDTNSDHHICLWQIRSTSLGQGLLSPVTLLFNCPIRDIMPIPNRPPINTNHDEDHNETLMESEAKLTRTMILSEIIVLFQ